MNSELQSTDFSPDYVSPPGETIEDLLDETSMTQRELATRLGVSTKHLNQVIKGAAPLSADLALGLEKVFNVSADFWMTREAIYRTRLAKQEQAVALSGDEEWAEKFPIKEMKARGLLPEDVERHNLTEAILKFLGIASPRQWQPPAVAYRKSHKLESDDYALAAWLRLGELLAQDQFPLTAPYDASRFRTVLNEARTWTRLEASEWQPKLTAACADAGVILVITEHFKDAKVNGATRWLSPDKPLIQLSLRYKWEDVFWFTFFHEAGHVLKHRKKGLFIEIGNGSNKPDDPDLARFEVEADRFAADTLVPPDRESDLKILRRLSDVEAFADELAVCPAIVVGRLQHDGLWPFSKGNGLRRQLRFTS